MQNILIIKTGSCEVLDLPGKKAISLGDVLRSTCLLKVFKNDCVDWLTSIKASPLLKENPSINKLYIHEQDNSFSNINFNKYDLIINLEKDPPFEVSQNVKQIGFIQQASKVSHTPGFREIWNYVTNTETRKVKRKSLERLLIEAIDKRWTGQDYDFSLSQKCPHPEFDIALNWSVGNKFPTKAYELSKWRKADSQLQSLGYTTQWQKHLNDLEAYIHWLQSSRLIITSDSLGLHLAVAMRKPFVALFGPTLSTEFHNIEDKGEVLKDVTLPCLGCYKKTCDIDTLCMKNITTDEILKAVRKRLTPLKDLENVLSATSN